MWRIHIIVIQLFNFTSEKKIKWKRKTCYHVVMVSVSLKWLSSIYISRYCLDNIHVHVYSYQQTSAEHFILCFENPIKNIFITYLNEKFSLYLTLRSTIIFWKTFPLMMWAPVVMAFKIHFVLISSNNIENCWNAVSPIREIKASFGSDILTSTSVEITCKTKCSHSNNKGFFWWFMRVWR